MPDLGLRALQWSGAWRTACNELFSRRACNCSCHLSYKVVVIPNTRTQAFRAYAISMKDHLAQHDRAASTLALAEVSRDKEVRALTQALAKSLELQERAATAAERQAQELRVMLAQHTAANAGVQSQLAQLCAHTNQVTAALHAQAAAQQSAGYAQAYGDVHVPPPAGPFQPPAAPPLLPPLIDRKSVV